MTWAVDMGLLLALWGAGCTLGAVLGYRYGERKGFDRGYLTANINKRAKSFR